MLLLSLVPHWTLWVSVPPLRQQGMATCFLMEPGCSIPCWSILFATFVHISPWKSFPNPTPEMPQNHGTVYPHILPHARSQFYILLTAMLHMAPVQRIWMLKTHITMLLSSQRCRHPNIHLGSGWKDPDSMSRDTVGLGRIQQMGSYQVISDASYWISLKKEMLGQ
jgi:hypothetical protein